MEKRALLALALAMVVLIGWQILFPPPPPEKPDAPAAPGGPGITQPATPETTPAPAPVPGAGPAAGTESFTDEEAPAAERLEAAVEEEVVVETDKVRVALTNRGARIVSWTLKEFADDEGRPYELVSPAAARTDPPVGPLSLLTPDEGLDRSLAGALFTVERMTGAGGRRSVTLRWADGRGLEATKTLTLHPEVYLADLDVSLTNAGRPVESSVMWGPGIGTALAEERGSYFDYVGRGVFATTRGTVDRVPAGDVEVTRVTAAGALAWAALEEQYFSAFFLPQPGDRSLPESRVVPFTVLPEPGGKEETHIAVAVETGVPLRLYAGPKEYDRLKGLPVSPSLGSLVDFGREAPLIGPILRPIIEPLGLGLYHFLCWLHGIVPNWGVAIMLLTATIKILFYPLTQRGMVKMRRTQQEMGRLQPKVRAIREKYKKVKGAEARQKMNQEMMELYRREGVNPLGGMGGCLPLLLQLPFLYAFYNVLTVSIELRNAPFFGWIHDLADKDPYYVMPILMGVTMFIQQKMAMTKVTDPQQRAQQRMMMFMPVMFTIFFINLPAGLNLYWFVNNLLTIGQQALINRHAERVMGDGADAAEKKKKKKGKVSKMPTATKGDRRGSGAPAGRPASASKKS